MYKQVIFYGAGACAKRLLYENSISDQVQLKDGVCFADCNTDKHGTVYLGLPVMSIDEAFIEFPEASIFVTIDAPAIFDVLYWLTIELGIQEEKVINYVKVEKICSCHFLDTSIALRDSLCLSDGTYRNVLQFACCELYGKGNPKIIFEGELDLEGNLKKLELLRRRLIRQLSNGESCECTGCRMLNEKIAPPNQPKITNIVLGSQRICNFRCSYCTIGKNFDEANKQTVPISLPQFLRAIRKYNGGKVPYVYCYCAYGEVTLLKYRDKVYDELDELAECTEVLFLTNASVYDKGIHRKLMDGSGSINVSLDSGTAGTFAYVKKIDCFDRVVENLRLYNDCRIGELQLKYIFLPGINDNAADVEGFVALAVELGASRVQISSNRCDIYENYDNEITFRFASEMYEKLKCTGISVEVDPVDYVWQIFMQREYKVGE